MNSIINRLHLFFFTIALIIFLYVFYRSEIHHEGSIRNYYLPYYFISIFIIFLGFVSLFLKNENKKNLLTSLISIFFSFYLLEVLILVSKNYQTESDKKSKIYYNETGENYDKRSAFEAYLEEKIKNPELKIKIGPHDYINELNIDFLPLSGISNSFTFYCNENGYYSYYNTDRHGFRNPDFEWDKDIIDYLLVGDSFTLGACVNSPNDISGNLRNLFKSKSILNLGYGGNGPLISYSVLREYLPQKKVKNILFLFYEENELEDLINELKNPILKKYFNNKSFSQNLFSRQEEIDKTNILKIENEIEKFDKSQSMEMKLKFKQSLKLFRIRNIIKNIFKKDEVIIPSNTPEFETILIKFKNLAEANNSNFYFVYLPTYYRYDNKFNNLIYKETLDLLNKLQINLINIKDSFDQHSNPKSLFPFEMYGHYNLDGYRFVSKKIFEFFNN